MDYNQTIAALLQKRPNAARRKAAKEQAELSQSGALQSLTEMVNANPWLRRASANLDQPKADPYEGRRYLRNLARSQNPAFWHWPEERGSILPPPPRFEYANIPPLWDEWIPFRDDYLQIPSDLMEFLEILVHQAQRETSDCAHCTFSEEQPYTPEQRARGAIWRNCRDVSFWLAEITYEELPGVTLYGLTPEYEVHKYIPILHHFQQQTLAFDFNANPSEVYLAKQFIRLRRWLFTAIYTPWGRPCGIYSVSDGIQTCTQYPAYQTLRSPKIKEPEPYKETEKKPYYSRDYIRDIIKQRREEAMHQ